MNIMLDLETMGTNNNAAMVATGLVKFDLDGIKDTLYTVVDLESSIDLGGEIDASTILWWMKQSPNAREEIASKGMNLYDALYLLDGFIDMHDNMWGNGSDFDNVILINAFKHCDIDLPWRHTNNRCYRTMKAMAPTIKMNRVGIQHNALDDAKSQALHLIDICKHLGIML